MSDDQNHLFHDEPRQSFRQPIKFTALNPRPTVMDYNWEKQDFYRSEENRGKLFGI